MSRSTRGAQMHALMRACYRTDGDLAGLRGRFLYELGRVVPFDAAFMAAADPETLLFTAAFADEPLAEAGPLFLDNEFGAEPDVNRFAALATAPDPVTSLDAATSGQRNTSARSREIMAPLGMGDEARVAFRVDGATWGFLCVHRSGSRGFDSGDLATLRTMAPHMGEAIRRTVAMSTSLQSATDAGTSQGLIIVAEDRIVAFGGAAEYWLEQIGFHAVVAGDPLPLPLLAVVRRLDALDALDELAAVDQSQHPRLPAALRLATSSGALLSVHATRLRDAVDDRSVALTIAPAAGVERVSLLLATHGLTAAQRRVAELVLRGHTTRQIVVELQISAHTVQDHLKAVFDKTGVRSRRELVTAMMQPPGS